MIVNYIEKLFCVEILEKISRMRRFLLSEPDESRHQGIEITGIFLKALDGILNYIEKFIIRLSKDYELSEYERFSLIRQLSSIFNSIDELHSQLQFVYGSWVRPETNIFIENILAFIPNDRRPKKVNIILSNNYSFEESNLSSYLNNVLSKTSIPVDLQSEIPTVFLPKIECDNPLNWAILAHECGHIDQKGIQSILHLPKVIPPNAKPNTKIILERWAEEIYCDLFATQILGPAYLASFAMFAFFRNKAGGSDINTDTHPSDIVRICIILEILKKNNLKVALSKSNLNSCNDVASFFYNVLEERNKLDRNSYINRPQQPTPPLVLQEFVDEICDHVDQIISLSQQLTLKDFSRIDSLLKRLSKGIIIGAYPHIEKKRDLMEAFSKGKINDQKLIITKEAIQESRTLLWEIVNTGWLYKIEVGYPFAFELFFSSNNLRLAEKIEKWGEYLENIDRLLLKSIESSEIQRLMEGL